MKKGYIAVMIAVIAWGLSFINSKIALTALEPMTLCFFRFLIALIIILIISVITKKDLSIKLEDLKYFILAGGVGISVYFYFENTGVKYITPSSASLILASLPIATMFAEGIKEKTKITKKMIFSGILSLIGVAIIIGGNISFSAEEMKGYLMMIFAIFSWVVYSLATKELFKKYSQFKIVFYQFLFGVLFAFPFIFIENNRYELLNNSVIINVFLLGIFASTIGFFAYNYSMKILGISKASLFINLMPVFTIIFSYFYYGSLINIKQILGGVLVIVSVLINRDDKEVIYTNSHRNVGD